MPSGSLKDSEAMWIVGPSPSQFWLRPGLTRELQQHPHLSTTPRPDLSALGRENLHRIRIFRQFQGEGSPGGGPLLESKSLQRKRAPYCSKNPTYVNSSTAENTCLYLLWEEPRRTRKTAATGTAAVPEMQSPN